MRCQSCARLMRVARLMVQVIGLPKRGTVGWMIMRQRSVARLADVSLSGLCVVRAPSGMMKQSVERGPLTGSMWWIMWVTWISFLGQQAADVERFSGTLALVGLRCFPLMLFIWFAVRDSLRLLIWYELVLLFYFTSAVEAAFAYQADALSIAGLTLVIVQFIVCMLYIRYRGREVRAATS